MLIAEASSDSAFHVHGERVLLPTQLLFIPWIADQFGHREQSACGDTTTDQHCRTNRRPALALEIDHLGCHHEIADALPGLERSGKAHGHQQSRSIRHSAEARPTQAPAQRRLHCRRSDAGFQHQHRGTKVVAKKSLRADEAIRICSWRETLWLPFSAPHLRTTESSTAGSAAKAPSKWIDAAKVHRLAPQGEDDTRNRDRRRRRYQLSCHSSIFRLSPIRLLTPSAADGSYPQ